MLLCLGNYIITRQSMHGLKQIGIDNQRIEFDMHGVDMHVLMYELAGLRTEAMPEQLACCRHRFHRPVNLNELSGGTLVFAQHRIR